EMRLWHFRQPGDQRLRPGRKMPGAQHRLRLRYGARAGDHGARWDGEGVSTPDRSRQRRTAEGLRGDYRGRELGRPRGGAARTARMPEHFLFLTGRMAKPRVAKVLAAMQPTEFTYDVQDVGVKVAALMTGDLIRRRLAAPVTADRIMLPGRCRADL